MRTETAPNAMIATPHHVASTIGIQALRDGGSAIDAAIAANAALTVLLPDQTSIGGDCFFMVWENGSAQPEGFNGSGRAPKAASAHQVRQAGHERMPRRGPWTVTVPGTIDAWFQAHERHGRLPMQRLLAPASNVARTGFPISSRLAAAIAVSRDDLAAIPHAAAIYLNEGVAPSPGFRLANTALADSLDLIGRVGRDAFYSGSIADEVLEVTGGAAGWMTAADLAGHRGAWVEPVSVGYRDSTIWELPPNSQGVTALLGLGMMEREPFGSSWNDANWLHVQIEAKKRAFAIRYQYLGDPDAMTVSVDDIVTPDVVDRLWSDFNPTTPTSGNATLPGDTVYVAAIDSEGVAVSLIQSIYQGFGSGLIAGDSGIVLQNRGSYFSLVEEHPNELGGGKLPLHTLMPGMIDIPGRARGAFGTQGGDTQAQIHMQLASHLVDDNVAPGEALARPRWFSGDTKWGNPFNVVVEAEMPPDTIAGLQELGHQVTQVEPGWPNAGYAQIVMRNTESGMLMGAADPRSEGSAEGT